MSEYELTDEDKENAWYELEEFIRDQDDQYPPEHINRVLKLLEHVHGGKIV